MASVPQAAAAAEQRSAWPAILSRFLFALVVVGLLVAYGSTFTVQEQESAIVTRFGQPVQQRDEPGLYAKWPWPVEQVHFIDRRYKYHNTPFTETFTYDRKNVVMETYVVWRVEEPLLFFQSLGRAEEAEQKLDGMVSAAKNFHMGNFALSSLVSTDPDEIRTPEIERLILEDVRKDVARGFGIAVAQVGVKRIAYPEDNMEAVLEQMRAERRSEAVQLRAEGNKRAEAIRNEGLVQAERIIREAREEAGTILGRAEKEAAETFAKAHQLDPDFYRFWRSMQVIRNTLGAKSTVILRSDQEPFRELFESESTVLGPRKPALTVPMPTPDPEAGP